MEKLFDRSNNLVKLTRLNFQRYLLDQINWDNRLIAIRGARGVGKTTLLLQHIKISQQTGREVIYISLDDLYFSSHTLVDFTDEFVKNGGKYLYLDELHKYPNWSQEIKNIYDSHPDLKIVFTASSLLQIYKGYADLSRRAVSYDLNGLSFREYLEFEKQLKYEAFSLEDVISRHTEIVQPILTESKPLAEFKDYLSNGYYPFYKESKTNYYQKIRNILNLVLETDLPAVAKIEYNSIAKIKKLLFVVASSVPFMPNILKLSELIGTNRHSVLQYLDLLADAGILNLLTSEAKGLKYMSKPDKIFLNNSDIMYALVTENVNTGNLRETFFLNQLNATNSVTSAKNGDFMVNGKYVFEIGGKNKDFYQIKDIENSFLVLDNIETGIYNKLPLWLFGFLY
jgi:uncharacterized protein